MIELDDVGYSDPDREPVLRSLSLRIAADERVVVLGVNGSGKSTLLKILDGLLFPTQGEYRYRGQPLTHGRLKDRELARRFRSEVVYLFQSPDTMLFNPTVYDEIAFGPCQLGLADVDERVHHWADRVGVKDHLRRPPFELSGGEKQKVCLASLLAIEPKLLLMDEPTANLDPRSTGWLVDFLQETALTSVTTTHNLSLGAELGTRTLVLSESHELLLDGDVNALLEDTERLLAANLIHRHRHRHGKLAHRHFHAHDWD